MKKGIILLGHGSKVDSANNELYQIGKIIKENNGFDIFEVAFLQLCTPLLNQVVDSCIGKGATHIIIVPYFLYRGNHLQKDIPEEIEEMKKKFPHVTMTLAGHIGPDPLMADLVSKRIENCTDASS